MTHSHDHKPTCQETGYCEVHGVEIERRKNLEAKIDSIANTVSKKLPNVTTSLNRMIGYSVLATLIITGSYVYARDISARSDTADRAFEVKIEKLTQQVQDLTTAVARTEQRHDTLVDQLQILNANLEQIYKSK